MRVRGRWTVGLVLLGTLAGLLTTVAAAIPAAACSCVQWTDAEAVAAADAVFSGTVETVERVGPRAGGPDAARVFTVAVDETFTGTTASRQAVRTALHSATCGVRVRTGDRVLVFATTGGSSPTPARNGEMTTNSCSGTRVLDGPVPESVRAAAEPELVECATAIDVVDRLPSGYRSIAGVVALPVGQPIAFDRESGPPHFAKAGLAVRAGVSAALRVDEGQAGDVAIAWGSATPSATLRVEPCATIGATPWVVFAGGFWVDRGRCVRLAVTGERTERVGIGVGTACRPR